MSTKRSISDYSRQELYDLIWSTPAIKLAADFGISDVAVAKHCKKLNIPRPSVGYWAKIAAGQTPPKSSLPPTKEEIFAQEARRPMPKTLPLPTKTHPLHQQASDLFNALNNAKLDSYKRAELHSDPSFPEVVVSKDLAERAAKAFHVILNGLEPLGINWRKSQSSYHCGHFRKGNDRLQLSIAEDLICPDGSRRCPPTYESPRGKDKLSGLLTIALKTADYFSKEIKTWPESNKLPLEEILAQIVATIRKHYLDAQERRALEAIEAEKRRIESERHWREYQKQEAIRLQKEKEQKHAEALAAAKQARKANLLKAAERWRFSSSLLQFVEDCERHWKSQSPQLTPEQLSWLSWARETAGTTSPSSTGYPDPTKDGAFDPASIPFGGPYPSTRDLE